MDLRRNLQSQESESVSMGTQADTVPYMDGAKTEAETELDQEVQETESHIRRKLIEIHSRYVRIPYVLRNSGVSRSTKKLKVKKLKNSKTQGEKKP